MKAEVYTDYDLFEADSKPGSVFMADGDGDRPWLHHHCPGCGLRTGLRLYGPNHPFWVLDSKPGEPISISPSVHHSGGCGWHGFLKNGEWA